MYSCRAPSADGLASAVIAIGMAVTPIPIRRLLLRFRLSKGAILFVLLAEVLAVGTVFVVVPIVVVLVGTIIDPVAVRKKELKKYR